MSWSVTSTVTSGASGVRRVRTAQKTLGVPRLLKTHNFRIFLRKHVCRSPADEYVPHRKLDFPRILQTAFFLKSEEKQKDGFSFIHRRLHFWYSGQPAIFRFWDCNRNIGIYHYLYDAPFWTARTYGQLSIPYTFPSSGTTAQRRPGPPNSWGFCITRTVTP